MRILFVHNRYLIRGGEDRSADAEEQLLRDGGHEVLRYDETNERVAALGRLRTAMRTIWSREGYNTVGTMIARHKPDVMHVQNFFPLISPSVHHAAHSRGVPVVQTIRNFRLFCLNGCLSLDGKVCELCLGRSFALPGVIRRCYRDSTAGSLTVAAMQTAHRMMGTWENHVDAWIALSEFSRNKLIAGGIPAGRIHVKANFLTRDPGPGKTERRGALFVGRLSAEKGLPVLLDAWQTAGLAEDLTIVGEGPLRSTLQAAPGDTSGIGFTGELGSDAVYGLMKQALFVVLPSVCYENMPRTVIEAFACGTPILASRLGALPEMVEHEKTGLLFEPGDPASLAKTMQWAFSHKEEMCRMGGQAREVYLTRYRSDSNLTALIGIYEAARTVSSLSRRT